MLKSEDLDPVEKELMKIDNSIKDLVVAQKFSQKHQISHFHGTCFDVS